MDTVDAGIFDDESAQDWFWTEVEQPLVGKIIDEIEDLDERNGAIILAAIEVFTILCEHAEATPPKPDDVAGWRASYLASWNSYIDKMDLQPGYKQARLQTIAATFDRLNAAARKAWQKAS